MLQTTNIRLLFEICAWVVCLYECFRINVSLFRRSMGIEYPEWKWLSTIFMYCLISVHFSTFQYMLPEMTRLTHTG